MSSRIRITYESFMEAVCAVLQNRMLDIKTHSLGHWGVKLWRQLGMSQQKTDRRVAGKICRKSSSHYSKSNHAFFSYSNTFKHFQLLYTLPSILPSFGHLVLPLSSQWCEMRRSEITCWPTKTQKSVWKWIGQHK